MLHLIKIIKTIELVINPTIVVIITTSIIIIKKIVGVLLFGNLCMDNYRKESARRFGILLRNALKIKYPFVKITSIFLASQYNLRCSTSNTISNETARKWVNGISLPCVHRFQVLRDWLDIDSNFIARYDELSPSKINRGTFIYESKTEQLISKLLQSNLFNDQQIQYIKKIAMSIGL